MHKTPRRYTWQMRQFSNFHMMTGVHKPFLKKWRQAFQHPSMEEE